MRKGMTTGGISEEEIERAKNNCKIGDRVKVFNHWHDGNYKSHKANKETGKWEYAKIIKKFKHIVLLDNKRSVDYADIVMQRRGDMNV